MKYEDVRRYILYINMIDLYDIDIGDDIVQ